MIDDKNWVSKEKCYHTDANLGVNNFCPSCGQSLKSARETGEIRRMVSRLKQMQPAQVGIDAIMYVLKYVCVSQTLRWCLNEISDDDLLSVLTAGDDVKEEKK